MTVVALVSVPEGADFDVCTLAFSSLRVGFPSATIKVYDNGNGEEVTSRLKPLADSIGAELHRCIEPKHHADWISLMVRMHDGPLRVVDTDTIWWESCEGFDFDSPLAGRFVPTMWNEFSQCPSFARLHTSFMWIRDCAELCNRIREAYPPAHSACGEYCPCNPFLPAVGFVGGKPVFWDSTAMLYNMIGGAHFEPKHLECYTHVNSASFYKVMLERVENKTAFARQHELAKYEPEKLRGFWRAEDRYYAEMNRRYLEGVNKQ